MMKYIFLVGCFLSFYVISAQNSSDQDAVKLVILDLFDAMRETDSVKMKACFYEDVAVFTAFTHPEKGNILKKANLQKFITSVGTPHEGLYDERLGSFSIHVDGPLASMSVDYYFFIDDKFSHCGVNYFQLFNENNRWKIYFLSDTRRKVPCNVPDKTW